MTWCWVDGWQVRPSNCLIVEVFYLAGKDNPKDQIVGWGVLPMCNPRFRVVQGRFKIPLLKVSHHSMAALAGLG